MNLENYVMENILKPIIKEDKDGKCILEEDYDKLNLTYNEKKFIIALMNKNDIQLKRELVTKSDRPSRVSNFEYGSQESSGTLDRDMPAKADIEYNENGDLVFENYEKLDEFLEREFIPEHVTLKKKVKSNDDKLYPFIQLGSIVKLRLSELENKHVLEYLKENGIYVRGKDASIDGEFENYDYYQTYKSSILPEAILGEEQAEKFKLYYLTKDPVIREQLIIGSMRLAAYVAHKMNVIYGFDINELQSYAYEGLIGAVDRFNPAQDKKFSSYAYKYIKGYILSGITELEGINRTSWSYGFLSAKREVERATGLSLTEHPELANEIIDIMVKNGVISKTVAKDFPTLIQIVYCKESLTDAEEEAPTDEADLPENIIINEELKEKMAQAIETLAPREQKVLELRFGLLDGHTRTLEETAKEFGVNRERIRQIEAKALRKMRHPRRSREIRPYAGIDSDYYSFSEENNQNQQKTYLDEMIAKHTGQKR